jgi:hypothetical protein
VSHHAFDHRGDLGGRAVQDLGVDCHRAFLDVPVDEHAATAVAGVPLGEDVAVECAEVAGVRGDGGCALTPDPRLPRGECGVRDLDAGCFQAGRGEVPPGGVAQLVLAVGMIAGRDGPQAAVGAVRVGDQQQPLDQDVLGQAAACPDTGQRAQRAGTQRRFLEHLDQRDGPPPRDARPFQLSQVTWLA